MDFGINLATAADSWKIVKRAEDVEDSPRYRCADSVEPHRARRGERTRLTERARAGPRRRRALSINCDRVSVPARGRW